MPGRDCPGHDQHLLYSSKPLSLGTPNPLIPKCPVTAYITCDNRTCRICDINLMVHTSIHIYAHSCTSTHSYTSIGSTRDDNTGCFDQLHARSKKFLEVSQAVAWVQPIPHGSLRSFACSHVSIPIPECQLSPGLIPNSARAVA